MRTEIIPTNQVILTNGKAYQYANKPYLLKNTLGVEIDILDKYYFTSSDGIENFTLYKTKEGNWYELTEESDTGRNTIIRSLKIALDNYRGNIGRL